MCNDEEKHKTIGEGDLIAVGLQDEGGARHGKEGKCLGEMEGTYGDGVHVALRSASNLDDSDLEAARVGSIATSRSGSLRRDGGGHALGDDLGDAKGDESDNVDNLHLESLRESW